MEKSLRCISAKGKVEKMCSVLPISTKGGFMNTQNQFTYSKSYDP